MKSIDIFLNFPILDMNRNVLRKDTKNVRKSDILRMNNFWGDDSWKTSAYSNEESLFKDISYKTDSKTLVNAYIDRLKNMAGFKNISKPLPMKNLKGGLLYYLIFASQKPVANKIITEIFKKYR